MAEIITVSDLPAKVQEHEMVAVMVAGANARASRVAPCLAGTGEDAPSADLVSEAKLILIGAVQRWADSGSGAATQLTAGPFSQSIDTRQRTGFNLWPSEITDLQALCKAAGETGREAFSIDTAPASSAHLPWCSLMLGATYCSCGVDIAGFPLWETE